MKPDPAKPNPLHEGIDETFASTSAITQYQCLIDDCSSLRVLRRRCLSVAWARSQVVPEAPCTVIPRWDSAPAFEERDDLTPLITTVRSPGNKTTRSAQDAAGSRAIQASAQHPASKGDALLIDGLETQRAGCGPDQRRPLRRVYALPVSSVITRHIAPLAIDRSDT
jgi:hypothetical protein